MADAPMTEILAYFFTSSAAQQSAEQMAQYGKVLSVHMSEPNQGRPWVVMLGIPEQPGVTGADARLKALVLSVVQRHNGLMVSGPI